MFLLKKLRMVIAFCLGVSQVYSIDCRYDPLPEEMRPKGTVTLAYHGVTEIEFPLYTGGLLQRHPIVEVGSRKDLCVDVIFRSGSAIPAILVPEGFPQDINKLIPPFILNHMNEDDDLFSRKISNFSSVTGILIDDCTFQDPENERGLQKIGTRTWTPLTKPLDFFKNLRNKIKEVQNQGVIATLRHNPDLMEVMNDILWRNDLTHINWHNLRNLGHMFSQCALGSLKSESEDYFTLKRGAFSVVMEKSEDPVMLKKKAKTFMEQAFLDPVLDHLRSLFFKQASDSSVGARAALARQSAHVTEVGNSAENDLKEGFLEGSQVVGLQAERLVPVDPELDENKQERTEAAENVENLEKGLAPDLSPPQDVTGFKEREAVVPSQREDETNIVFSAVPVVSDLAPVIAPREEVFSAVSESVALFHPSRDEGMSDATHMRVEEERSDPVFLQAQEEMASREVQILEAAEVPEINPSDTRIVRGKISPAIQASQDTDERRASSVPEFGVKQNCQIL